MKYIVVLLAFFLFAFKADKTAFAEVSAVFDKLNAMPLSSNEASYLHYTVTSITNTQEAGSKNIVSRAEFEMYASSKQNRVYSKDMIVLKDQKNTFSILPSRKVIYISDAVTGKKNETLYSKLKILQETIFNNSDDVISQSSTNSSFNKIITLTLNKKMANYLDIKKVSYYINTTNNTLHRVFVEYLENKPIVSLDYVFNKSEFNCRREDMRKPVKSLVFLGDKKLAPRYQDFKVIDNRKK